MLGSNETLLLVGLHSLLGRAGSGVLLLPSFVPLLVFLFSLAFSLSLSVPPFVVLLVFVAPHTVFVVLIVAGVHPFVIRCTQDEMVRILIGQSLGCLRHLGEFCSRVLIECPIEDAFVNRIQHEQIVY